MDKTVSALNHLDLFVSNAFGGVVDKVVVSRSLASKEVWDFMLY